MDAPSSALSARLVLDGAAPGGGDVTEIVNRVPAPAAYTANYTTAGVAIPGTYPLVVTFFDAADATGEIVATAQANVTIAANGAGIGDIAVSNTVASVTVDAGQFVHVPLEKQLTFTARDAQNAIVAVTPGSAFWSQVNGAANMTLTQDGKATAVQPGSSEVTVTVDGVTSASTAVTVPTVASFSNASFETPAFNTNQWFSPGPPESLWSGSATWGMANGTAAWGDGGNTGAQYAFVQASNFIGILRQTVTGLTVGQRYEVSFWFSRRDGNVGGNSGTEVRVLADGVQIMAPTFPTGDGAWTKITTSSFVAAETDVTFEFIPTLSGQDRATLIDDVELTAVP